MKCDVQAATTFNVSLDMTAFATIERALSFYRDRAILSDGDPAVELSRQFTTLLMKLRNNPRPQLILESPQDEPDAPLALPEAPEATNVPSDGETPQEGSPAPSDNPLEQELEDMIGGQNGS